MKKFRMTLLALTTAFLTVVQASAATPTETTPNKNGLAKDLMKASSDGYSALRAIHLARIAIFNGETKRADEMLDKAKKDLDAATKDAQAYAADSKAADHGKKGDDKSAGDKTDSADMITIDGELGIADTFVPSTEKKKHIDKANDHLKSGHSKEALEELRLGEVEVIYSRVMLPLETTKKRVADAEKLAGEHKYYEANLALKAAEDGIVIDSVDLLGTPVPASSAAATSSTKK